jgi:molybdenum cofactor synthesis domain-containing protein
MRPIRETIPLQEAREIIDQATSPVARVERVPLAHANRRVLAADVVSPMDVPPFARAAMDGYAVMAADTFGAGQFDPKVLRVVETVYTGQVPARPIGAGECTEIATGAPLPPGADAVVMVEETEKAADGQVRLFSPVYPAQNVGRRGADIKTAQVVLRRGDLLTPSRVGAMAAIGLDEVDVFAKPRVAILSTGNEVVAPGEPLPPGAIYDINKFTLTAIIVEHGGVAEPHRTPADALEDLGRALDEAAGADLIVFSGGSSVGERDLILDALAQKGEVLFHGIAVKPGKPTLFGLLARPSAARRPESEVRSPESNGPRTSDSALRQAQGVVSLSNHGLRTPVLGMPGYPTSCLSNGYMLLAPLLRRLAHLPPLEPRTVTVPLGQRVVSTTGRHQFYTVRIVDGVAMPAFKASGDISSMSQADGYIEIPAQTDIVEKGQMVEVRLF